MSSSFWQSGHKPTLFAAFLYFDISFMVWVMLGPLAVQIAVDLALTPAQKGLMVAVPVLAGAFLRIVLGLLVDRIGPKRTGLIAQGIVIAGLALAFVFGVHAYWHLLLLGCCLGMAGASFAVALPLASRWYPPEHQGKALGIAGAGNSGTVLASLFLPALAASLGWNNAFGIITLPLLAVLLVYSLLAQDSPNAPPPRTVSEYLAVLKDRDTWWFMFFYSVTFGGFVGLASSLPLYFHDQYALSPVHAGYFTAACVFAGSLVRPLGGLIADRIGGTRTLSTMYAIAAIGLIIIGCGLPSAVSALPTFVGVMLSLGVGNGALFQIIPQRFQKEIGSMTGLVGCAGGIGGFYLASSLGLAKQWTGSYQIGFLLFAALALVALSSLSVIKARWRMTWGAAHLSTARI